MYPSSRRTQTDLYSSEQVKRVLLGAGINIANEVDSDYIIYCPYHNNHRTPAAEVSKTYGTFFCFSCQTTKTLIEFVMFTSNRSFFEATRYIKSKETDKDIERDINKALVAKPQWTEFDSTLISKLNYQALNADRSTQYYQSRNITLDSMKKFQLGYSEKQDMVSIPVHNDEGLCIGFVARSIEGKEFKNTPGLPKSKILFNLNRVKSETKVYVLESSFDVIRLDQLGMPAVATLGANVSTEQINLLKKYFNDIIIITDNDDAGNTMYEKIQSKLSSRVSRIKLSDKYKDIGDMSDEDILKIQYSFENDISAILGV
jgi:DNA primase